MHDEQPVSPVDEKNKQNRNLIIIVSILILILLGVYWIIDHGSENHKVETNKMESVSFASPITHSDAQSVWMERAQNQLKDVQNNTTELKQTVEKMQNADSQKSLESDPRYQALQQQVEALQKVVDSQTEKPSSTVNNGGNYKGQVISTVPESQQNNSGIISEAAGIDNDVINLKSKPGVDLPNKNPDSFVPAGTFAEAIMLGAADASAGVNSQSKPIPVLFRITALGTLPNHRKSHLKDCVVIGAVTGDISSERGEIRLERMSCVFSNNEIVEQVIEGTIYGIDGKNGVRGNPAWRDGPLLVRVGAAGTLSGLGKGIADSYVTNSISPLGTTQTVDNGAIFKNGLANGASNGLEKLADYYVKRAELYHPVIQLSAGQPVDIVILKGFYLDGKKHDDLDQETHTQPELFSNSSQSMMSSGSNLTLTESQLTKIKQHETALTSGVSNSGDVQ